MYSFKNWLSRKGHEQFVGDNDAIITILKAKMSEYEKSVIPRPRILTRSRSLYGYTFDLIYFKMDELPNIEFAIDVDFDTEGELVNYQQQQIPDFIVGTLYVYSKDMTFAESWEVQFWTTSFAFQLNWFKDHVVSYVRKSKSVPDTNWMIRKNYLMTFAGNINVGTKHCSVVDDVFNNTDLKQYIGEYI